MLLGETGVGKSTFINALLNYFSYTTLEEAERGELKYAVPSKFTHAGREIKVGADENESQVTGQSATQSPRAHVFAFGGHSLRIIDTPGIGDTRGIEKDKENIENILKYISFYQHLNAICILLKPNSSKLTVSFRYAIKELLVHLHKDASKILVFLYTNSRSTFYMPG